MLPFCFLLFYPEEERLLFTTEAINQQELHRAIAVSGFFRCLLHLLFASGRRRIGAKVGLVLPALPWGVSLQNTFSLALEPMFLCKGFGKPMGSTRILGFPSEQGWFSLFLEKKKRQLVSLPVCVACPSKSSSKLVLAFSSILVAGVGDPTSSERRTVNNRIEKSKLVAGRVQCVISCSCWVSVKTEISIIVELLTVS